MKPFRRSTAHYASKAVLTFEDLDFSMDNTNITCRVLPWSFNCHYFHYFIVLIWLSQDSCIINTYQLFPISKLCIKVQCAANNIMYTLVNIHTLISYLFNDSWLCFFCVLQHRCVVIDYCAFIFSHFVHYITAKTIAVTIERWKVFNCAIRKDTYPLSAQNISFTEDTECNECIK